MTRVQSVSLLVLHLLLACSDGGSGAVEPSGSTRQPLKAEDLAPGWPALLSAYEALRGDLANDSIAAAAGAAANLAQAAERSQTALPASQAPRLQALARSAQRLAGTSSADPARAAFGEVSRTLVDLLQAAPQQQAGLHLFECPMVDGYGKWVQSSDEVSNPYMGQRMLRCGAEREF